MASLACLSVPMCSMRSIWPGIQECRRRRGGGCTISSRRFGGVGGGRLTGPGGPRSVAGRAICRLTSSMALRHVTRACVGGAGAARYGLRRGAAVWAPLARVYRGMAWRCGGCPLRIYVRAYVCCMVFCGYWRGRRNLYLTTNNTFLLHSLCSVPLRALCSGRLILFSSHSVVLSPSTLSACSPSSSGLTWPTSGARLSARGASCTVIVGRRRRRPFKTTNSSAACARTKPSHPPHLAFTCLWRNPSAVWRHWRIARARTRPPSSLNAIRSSVAHR